MRIIILAVLICACQAAQDPENCRPPQFQNNGFFVPNSENYRTGDKITYGCNTGLKPDLKTWWGEITCKNGEWSHTPRCIDEAWCITTHVPNAKPDVLHAAAPGKYDFECDHGYWIEGGKSIAECVAGSWTLPECKRKSNSCAPPPRVYNGMITTPYRSMFENGEKIEYICASGYRLDGDKTNTCEQGTWSSNPSCVEVKCTNQPYVYNGREAEGFKISYNHGETVRFTCNRGYEFEGTDTARCEDGTWKLPVCKVSGGGSGGESLHPDQLGVLLPVRDCGSHPLIVNGDVIELPSGKELKVQCVRYYKLEGPKTVGCVKGEWTPLPECKPPCRVEGKRIHSSQSDEYLQEGEEKIFHCAVFKKITVRCTKGTTIYSECKWNLQHT